MAGVQGAVSLTATDCPTGRRTTLQCYLSIGRMVRLRSDGLSLLVPGVQRSRLVFRGHGWCSEVTAGVQRLQLVSAGHSWCLEITAGVQRS